MLHFYFKHTGWQSSRSIHGNQDPTIEALRGKWKKWKELWRIIPLNIFFTYFLSHKHRKENNQTVRLCKCVNVVSVPPCGSRLQSEFTFNLWVKNDWLDKMVKLCAAVFCYLNQLQYFNQIWHIIHCTVLYGLIAAICTWYCMCK